MQNSINGGRAYAALLRVTDDHASIANFSSGATIATPALSDAAIILKDDSTSENIVEGHGITFDENGVAVIKIDSTIIDLIPFLETAAPRKTGGTGSVTKNEKVSENGLKIGGAGSSSGMSFLLIYADGESGTNIQTTMAIVTVKKSSGSRSHKSGDYLMVPIECTSVACKKSGGFVIDQALFDATIWGTISAGNRTIGQDYYVKESLLPAA